MYNFNIEFFQNINTILHKQVAALRDYGNRSKRYRRNRTIIITCLLILIITICAIYFIRLINRNYSNYEVLDSIENTEENLGGYLEYNGAVIRYGKDGALAVDSNGDLLWNGSYEMADPIGDTCEEYAVIADRGGKELYIFNSKGLVGNIQTTHPIVEVQTAHQGVVAVLMTEEDTCYLELYSKEGELLGEKVTNMAKDGYPMDFSLSDDGKKLAATYICLNNGEVKNNIIFLNFGEVGKNYTDRTVGADIYDSVIVPRITFLDNNTVCAFKEDGLLIYSMEEKAELYKDIPLEGRIKSVLHDEKYAGAVLESENGEENRLLLYDLKGSQVLDMKLDFDYDSIYLSGDEIIMFDDLSCVIYRTSGKEKFRYTFSSNISAIYPINHLDRYFVVNPEKIQEIKLVE